MSSSLALASVTAVLKNLLENGLVDRGVSASIGADATVSALPPDRITTGTDERPQLNLFLYHVTPNTGMRRLARTEQQGDERRSAPLALDLHYLLTAYGAADLQTELLLGYALQLFQQLPTLDRDGIRTVLTALSAPEGGVATPALAALAASSLADQVERIQICPQFLGAEEMSKIWSALQARYRLSAAYKVSAVLIDGTT